MSDTRPVLDALMHEWHEWSSQGGRLPKPRYDGCYGMADFVLKHLDEWAAVVPWCAEHDGPMLPELDHSVCCYAYWSGHAVEACRLEEPARHYMIGEAT